MDDKKESNKPLDNKQKMKRKDEEDEKKNKKKMFIIIGIAIAAAIILIVVILLLFTFCKKDTGPEEVVTEPEETVETDTGPSEGDEETVVETEEPEPEPADEPEPEEEEEPEPDEEEVAIAPTVSLSIYHGPELSADGKCFYRVTADVTGSPSPSIDWSHEDASLGTLGQYNIQINLDNPSETVNLVATVENTAGIAEDSVLIEWGCNRAPRVDDIVLSGDIFIEDTYPVSAVASDPDGDTLTYSWSTTGGSILDTNGNPTEWLAPSYGGSYSITVTVDDGRGGTASRTETFEVQEPNRPPSVGKIVVREIPSGYPTTDLITGYEYTLDVSATDPDGDPLDYYWETTDGVVSDAYINPTTWYAPTSAAFVDITVTVDDGQGHIITRQKTVEVKYYLY